MLTLGKSLLSFVKRALLAGMTTTGGLLEDLEVENSSWEEQPDSEDQSRGKWISRRTIH
jgi:hypothetical protein